MQSLKLEKYNKEERIINKTLELISLPLSNFNTVQEQKLFNLVIFLAQKSLYKSALIDRDIDGLQRKIYIKYSDIKKFLQTGETIIKTEQIDKLIEKFLSTNIKTKIVEIFKDKKGLYEKISKRTTLFFEYVESNSLKKNNDFQYRKEYAVFKFNASALRNFVLIENDIKNTEYVKSLMSVSNSSKSIYTPKIIEMLSRYLSFNTDTTNKPYTIDLEDFKKIMGIEKKATYKNFKYVNSRILKEVQKEAEEKFNFKFEFEQIKKSKTVTGLKFIMSNEAKRKYKTYLDNIKYVSNDFHKEKRVLEPDKTFLFKSEDRMLIYTMEMHMRDSIEIIKKELEGIYTYNSFFKDIIPGEKFGDFIFISKNNLTLDKLVNYYSIDNFVEKIKYENCKLIEQKNNIIKS